MKALFASAEAGLIGLIFFFAVFVGVVLWVYHPKNKQPIEALKNIPLRDEEDNGRAK